MSSQKKLTKKERERRSTAMKASWAKRGSRKTYAVRKFSVNFSLDELTDKLEEMALDGWELHSIFGANTFIFEKTLKKGD